MELGMLSLYVMLTTCFTVILVVTKIPEYNLSGGNICLTLIFRGAVMMGKACHHRKIYSIEARKQRRRETGDLALWNICEDVSL